VDSTFNALFSTLATVDSFAKVGYYFTFEKDLLHTNVDYLCYQECNKFCLLRRYLLAVSEFKCKRLVTSAREGHSSRYQNYFFEETFSLKRLRAIASL
jgi:hypothetical protein